jgi:hypothetical protein
MSKKIILITSIFPYSSKEQFLETEVKYWGEDNDIEFIIMPIMKDNTIRSIPKNIKIDNLFTNNNINTLSKIINIPKIFTNKYLYLELPKLIKNPKLIPIYINALVKYLIYKNKLEIFIKKKLK